MEIKSMFFTKRSKKRLDKSPESPIDLTDETVPERIDLFEEVPESAKGGHNLGDKKVGIYKNKDSLANIKPPKSQKYGPYQNNIPNRK